MFLSLKVLPRDHWLKSIKLKSIIKELQPISDGKIEIKKKLFFFIFHFNHL